MKGLLLGHGRSRRFIPRRALCVRLVAGAAVAAAGFCTVLPGLRLPCDTSRLPSATPSTLVTDFEGRPIGATVGVGGRWCLPLPAPDLPRPFTAAVIALEDRRFRRHGGVDWVAAFRAAGANARSGRIVSGASTIPMQVARLAHPEPRGWGMKVRQVLRARDLERRFTKDEILAFYVNNLPFGGNLSGVEAGSRAYFGKPARELELAEAVLLAGVPQRPAHLRPDRFPEACRRRRDRAAERMQAEGVLSREEYLGILRTPVRLVLPREGGLRIGVPVEEPLFSGLLYSDSGERGVRVSTLDRAAQDASRMALSRGVTRTEGVRDGAAVVLDNASGAIRGYVGTLDFTRPGDGQVDACRAPRSSGSLLKPFIYAAAIDAGVLVRETVLEDAPLRLADYRPANFDGVFRLRVTAEDALSLSLNTPAVRLVREIGAARLVERLRQCGLSTIDRPAEEYGLAVALGGAEITLTDIASAYAGLARGGEFRPVHTSGSRRSRESDRPFSAGAAALVCDMLRTRALPGAADVPVCWKTGTSSGYRDAWCVAFNREVTVAVWLGNKSGVGAVGLVGAEAAAPVVAEIIRGLYRGREFPDVPAGIGTVSGEVCAESGLALRASCPGRRAARLVADVPLRPCPGVHADPARDDLRGRTDVTSLRIVSPSSGTYSGPDPVPVFDLVAAGDPACLWFVDGRYVASGAEGGRWALEPGTHRVRCVTADGSTSQCVDVSVAMPSARPEDGNPRDAGVE